MGNLCHSLTNSCLLRRLDWCDSGLWSCQLKTCRDCYCWCSETCWRHKSLCRFGLKNSTLVVPLAMFTYLIWCFQLGWEHRGNLESGGRGRKSERLVSANWEASLRHCWKNMWPGEKAFPSLYTNTNMITLSWNAKDSQLLLMRPWQEWPGKKVWWRSPFLPLLTFFLF